jgi:transketolase
MKDQEILQQVANTIRVLSAEGVQQANSGHPGLPMGCAEIAAVLWGTIMDQDASDSQWCNRDRFILSAGHGSMLLYSLLHLFGYKVTLDDLKSFRQFDSVTPGHPEFGHTHGVETTTGPLGQGIANAVGMGLASKLLAEKFNTDEHALIDNRIWVLCGDGCMMEGVSSEAASLAGHLGLGNITVIYDSNQITIEGKTDLAFTEDVAKRYQAYGWNVIKTDDGHDLEKVQKALKKAARKTDKPTLVITPTVIGKGAPNKGGSHKVHGEPLGEEELAATKQALGCGDAPFSVSEDVRAYCKKVISRGKRRNKAWQKLFDAWSAANPALKAEWETMTTQQLPADLSLPEFTVGDGVATRASSGKVLASLGEQLSFLYGGSADLAPSNKSEMPGAGDVNTDAFAGRNLHFGVREHAMGAICNGMSVYGMMHPYCATFLVFADYMRPAIRLAALMQIPVTYIFTHDSIYVGEDGPTHQPVEHAAALRCIPNLDVIRPADANEVKSAWVHALQKKDGPVALLLTRQNLPTLDGPAAVDKGAYIVKKEAGDTPDLILMASGSEVSLCLDAAAQIEAGGTQVRVVSVPCMEIFARQSDAYRDEILPPTVTKRLAVEAGVGVDWHMYVGSAGAVHSIERFGISAPAGEVGTALGFTPENVAELASRL